MPFSALPTKLPGQVIEAAYLNLNKTNTDDH